VRAERVHVDALAKAERALYDAGIQPLNVSDYGQARAERKKTDQQNLDGGDEERRSDAQVEKRCRYLYFCTSKASTFVPVKHLSTKSACSLRIRMTRNLVE